MAAENKNIVSIQTPFIMNHSSDHANFFWKEGYLYLPGFFSSEVMDKLNGMCLEHFGMDPEWWHKDEFIEESNCEIVPWFPFREGVTDFQVVDDNPELMRITTEILGEGWNNLYCMAMFSKKGTTGQAWHQDSPPENPEQFNLNRLVYTHDITDETGGQIRFVPGSHKKGEIPTGDPHGDIEGQMIVSPKKGDLILLHGHCWHNVLPVTGAYRVSTNFRAMPKGTPETVTDTAVYRNMRYYFPTEEIVEQRM